MCDYVRMDLILKNAYFFCSHITIVLIYNHPSLFVFSSFAVSSNRGVATKNKNSSLRHFNGQEYQSYSTIRKGLRAILYGNQGDERRWGVRSSQRDSAKKRH